MKQHVTPQELAKQLQDDIQGIFPRSMVWVKPRFRLMPSIEIRFTLCAEGDYPNNIEMNDPARHVIILFLSSEHDDAKELPALCPEKLDVRGTHAGRFDVKAKEPWMYCTGYKTGWKNFKGDSTTTRKRIVTYFERLKAQMIEQLPNMLDQHKAIAQTKLF